MPLIGARSLRSVVQELTRPTRSLPAWPLKRSGSNRYLVDQKGIPFFFAGDSPWWLATRLSTQDAIQYLNDRAARGFNSILMEAIDNTGGANGAANINGDFAFTTKQGGGAYTNGTSQSPDFSTPNDAYFRQHDIVMSAAYARGFHVFFYATWTGALFTDPSTEGFYNALAAQSSGIRQGYGAYIANHFAKWPNLIWVIGADANPADGPGANTATITDIVTGIQSVDTTHLFSFDSKDGNSPLTDSEAWTSPSDLVKNGINNVYSDQTLGHPYIQANAKTEWQRSDFPNVPYFLKETKYEDGGATAQYVRAQLYASIFGGCCGYHFGNTPLWNFAAGWQAQLGSRGTLDCQVGYSFITARTWWLLVPDWGNAVLTNGASYTNATFVPCAQASDGSWAALYTPQSQSLTIALGGFSAPVVATWIDPTSGAQQSAGAFSNSGSHTFSATPGNNAQGDADWILYFQT